MEKRALLHNALAFTFYYNKITNSIQDIQKEILGKLLIRLIVNTTGYNIVVFNTRNMKNLLIINAIHNI